MGIASEAAFAWRRLAAAGYRVAAMDVRGYGESTVAWPDYLAASVGADVVALIRALGKDQAILIGHDWGAPVAWISALLRPDLVRAVAGLSVPAVLPTGMVPPSTTRERYGEGYYQVYFQAPGVADAALDEVDAVSHQAARVGMGLDFTDSPDYVRGNPLATANVTMPEASLAFPRAPARCGACR